MNNLKKVCVPHLFSMLNPCFALWNLTWEPKECNNFLLVMFNFWKLLGLRVKGHGRKVRPLLQCRCECPERFVGGGIKSLGWVGAGGSNYNTMHNTLKPFLGHFKLKILIPIAWGLLGANKISTNLPDSNLMYMLETGYDGVRRVS